MALTNESNAALQAGHELEALIAAVTAGKKLLKETGLRNGAAPTTGYRTLVALRRSVTETHERNRFESGHMRGATHVIFSPDGSRLFSAGGLNELKGWTLDGTQVLTFETDHSACRIVIPSDGQPAVI